MILRFGESGVGAQSKEAAAQAEDEDLRRPVCLLAQLSVIGVPHPREPDEPIIRASRRADEGEPG